MEPRATAAATEVTHYYQQTVRRAASGRSRHITHEHTLSHTRAPSPCPHRKHAISRHKSRTHEPRDVRPPLDIASATYYPVACTRSLTGNLNVSQPHGHDPPQDQHVPTQNNTAKLNGLLFIHNLNASPYIPKKTYIPSPNLEHFYKTRKFLIFLYSFSLVLISRVFKVYNP